MRSVPCCASTLFWFLALLCACAVSARAQGPGVLDELLEKAQAAQEAGQYRNAAMVYAQATALSPATAELWSNRGIMEYLAGDDRACVDSMKRATELAPSLFTPALFSGKAYVDLGQPARALPFLHRAHTLRPTDPEVLLTLGEAEAGLHDSSAAESFYLQAAHASPENPKAWYGVGVAALESIEQNGSALARMQPSPIWARALLADDLLAQGRPMEASDTYRSLLQQATPAQKIVLLTMLRWTHDHAQELALPAGSASVLVSLSGEGRSPAPSACAPTKTLQAAGCAFWAGRFEDTAEFAAKTLALQPANAEAFFWSIKAQERIAVTALSRFEELAPHSSANYVLVGNLYRLQRQPDQALAEYDKALALDPHNPAALQGSILACLATNRTDQALTLDSTALNNRAEQPPFLPNPAGVPPELQPRLHYLLARAAESGGDDQTAVQEFELALPGDKDGSIHYQLSRLYRKKGEVAKAEKTLAAAKTLIAQHEVQAATALRDVVASSQK